MMDPGPEDRLGIMMKLARALDANRCDERCRVSLRSQQVSMATRWQTHSVVAAQCSVLECREIKMPLHTLVSGESVTRYRIWIGKP